MTESLSTDTKTVSGTDYSQSQSSEGPQSVDRWTKNISYRQLVISSCVGIFQMWWHPYVHDFRRLLPFLFLYQILSILIGYPLFYLELALGAVTKKGVISAWNIAPIARGVGFGMLTVCVFSALVAGTVGAWSLALFVHSCHVFLPWLHCVAGAIWPCTDRHRPLQDGTDTPSQSFFYNYVLNLKRGGLTDGLGHVVWELTIYYIIFWVLVYLVIFKRIYSYSKLVLFKDVITYFMLLCCSVGVLRLQGAGRMFSECDWSVMFESVKIWREAMEYSLIQMAVSQGSLIMLGSYCPKNQYSLGNTAMFAFAISKSCCLIAGLILGAAYGALSRDYDEEITIRPGPSASIILWTDYVARIPGSQFWSALLFFTLFLLSISTAALLVQTVMSAFTAPSIRRVRWSFLIVICLVYCMMGATIMCTKGGLYVVEFLMMWPVSKIRIIIAMMVSAVITYAYGQPTFCEDVYFAIGEYPSVFMRVCWALSPPLLLVLFIAGTIPLMSSDSIVGWSFLILQGLPIVVMSLFYLVFRYRVRNIVQEK